MAGGRFSSKIFPGARFGMLTVVERIPGGNGSRAKVRCLCDCGQESTPDSSNLTNGNSKSCGCEKRRAGARNKRAAIKDGIGYGSIIPGARFGRLVVIKRICRNGAPTTRVACICDCGIQKLVGIDGLVQKMTKSCGCLKSEKTAERNRKSAKFGRFSKEYPKTFASWRSMINRCYNEKQKSYSTYGADGIVVCEFLRSHPQNLVDVVGCRKKANPSLDRFPISNGNYTCGRCSECQEKEWSLNIRWTTRTRQSLNRGDFNVYITAFGKTLTVSQWAKLSAINAECIRRRKIRGWEPERILTTPDSFGNFYSPTSGTVNV